MPEAAELVKLIKKAAVEAVEAMKPVNVCFGIVESVSPLKINVEQKMTLGEAQLILSKNVTDYSIRIALDTRTEPVSDLHAHAFEGRTLRGVTDHDHEFSGRTAESGGSHGHRITGEQEIVIKNSLVTGDKVLLIRQQGGQKYFVLERVGA